MATLRIDSNNTFSTEVSVQESDQYTKSVFVKFERNYIPEEIRGVNEMFMTPTQLELLGKFLCRQADEIRSSQNTRS